MILKKMNFNLKAVGDGHPGSAPFFFFLPLVIYNGHLIEPIPSPLRATPIRSGHHGHTPHTDTVILDWRRAWHDNQDPVKDLTPAGRIGHLLRPIHCTDLSNQADILSLNQILENWSPISFPPNYLI